MKQKDFFLISLTVFLTIVAWIIADINHILVSSQIIEKDHKDLLKTKIEINEEVFSILEQKK